MGDAEGVVLSISPRPRHVAIPLCAGTGYDISGS